MTQDNGMDASPSWQELQAENARLRDALDHIQRTADNSRTMTRRLAFISERASMALNGEAYETGAIDLPKQRTPTPAQWELRYRHLKKERDGLAARYTALADEVRTLIQDSDGLAGYHLNGEVACWSELEAGHLLGEPDDAGASCLHRHDTAFLGDLAMQLDQEGDELLKDECSRARGRARKSAATVLANVVNKRLTEEGQDGE